MKMLWKVLTHLLTQKLTLHSNIIRTKMYSFSESSSLYTLCGRGCADVFMVPMFSDNYGYILVDRSTNNCLTIDPAQPEVIKNVIENLGLKHVNLLCTHKHNDHAGGNVQMKKWYPDLQVIATQYEAIPGITSPVGDGDTFKFGDFTIEVIYTPCHTKGHVCYLIRKIIDNQDDGPPILFCGDTLFVGGCGRFFEGTGKEMLNNMDRLSMLPSNTLVFCAHEYTLSNYKFLNSLDPIRVQSKYEWVQNQREANKPTVPR